MTLQQWADMCKLQQDVHRRENRHVDQGTVPKSSLDFFAVEPLLGDQQCFRASDITKFTCDALSRLGIYDSCDILPTCRGGAKIS